MDSSGISLIVVGVFIDFVMAYVPLWAAAQIVGMEKKKYRLFLGALSASILFLLILVLVAYGFIQLVSLPSAILAILSIPLSVMVAFYPVRLGTLGRLSAFTCFFTLLAAGTWTAVNVFMQWNTVGSGWDMATGFIIAIGTVLLVAELGWGIVHKHVKETLYLVPIRVFFGLISFETKALIDTGNELRDPLTGEPVVIVEYDALSAIIPIDIRSAFESGVDSPYEIISRIPDSSPWLRRIRLIPFRSIGNDNGMLIGLKPTRIEIIEEDLNLSITNVVIGIHQRRLSNKGDYQALLHPDLLETA